MLLHGHHEITHARMTHEVVAFAGGEGLYVIDAEGQHCALKYGQIDRTSQRA